MTTVQTTSTSATRTLGVLVLAGLALVVMFGLVLSPAEEVQGDAVRLLYVHVPSAWIAYLSFAVTALGSAAYLWKRTRSLAWDRVAGASAEIGVVLTALCLFTGSIWGRRTWGTYWTWDARLTTTTLLLLLFLGYLAIRRLPATHEVRARRSAIVGLIAFIDVPIVHQAVTWWRTLHQPATFKVGDAEMDGLMLFTLFLAVVVFTLLYVWVMLHRLRIAAMDDVLDDRGLAVAVAERVNEGRNQAVVPS